MHDLIAAAQASFAASVPPTAIILGAMAAVMMAALLRGFTGFGFGLAAVPLMGLLMAPAKAVPVAVLLQLLSGANDLRRNRHDCHWPSLRWLIVGAVIGSPLGVLMLSVTPAPVARIVIAALITGAVLMLGRGFAVATVPSPLVTTGVGLIAGLFNGMAGIPGPPAVVYYMSGPFRAVVARASMLVLFFATAIAAFVSETAVGLVGAQVLWLAAIGLPVMLLGTMIGEFGFRRGSDRLHRQVSITCLGLIALGSAIKGFSGLM
ncbi:MULTISPECIES: sulfite exporter TauE/SafE family protein [Rhodopseudomonas]|uniref:Probable membrane transporter protein n=1 Tax=Rhodopseudomonas palustris TaxID=1076 RepID=A0A0D7E4L6_RHOPL|nr:MULTISPECIES: sulfite exporter TauE/SafE family protein [Rhodopseudomonas]KIZ35365.1 hypothetical protein OO17_25815 [Rhodopseudomonas palustris]MDF3814082.1 sulfite exporter TauE/SafE family protein [Rhodopseudomonas sp. BAL398]WOK15767.1 sulfite exporter TauE/SafE family protein [Rhodopseudomonas sp. BAL398]